MQLEIIAIGAFALLAIGRAAWEVSRKRTQDHTDDARWMNAIR